MAQATREFNGEEPEDKVEAAWADEIERRVHAMALAGGPLASADEVFTRLRTHLAERRRRVK